MLSPPGNAAILKPSEIAVATSNLLAELLPKYLDNVCACVKLCCLILMHLESLFQPCSESPLQKQIYHTHTPHTGVLCSGDGKSRGGTGTAKGAI